MADRQEDVHVRRLSVIELEDVRCTVALFRDPVEAARAARLRYVSESMPGIRRVRSRLGPFKTEAQARRNVAQAIRRVASTLGNTPAVCRKSYVHPTVVEGYLAGCHAEACSDEDERCEEAVLALLERQARARYIPSTGTG